MSDEHARTLREIGGARGDLYAIADELETVKMILARLPSRAFVSRTLWMATASIWALLGAAMLLLLR